MPKCPNCGQKTEITKDFACQWCGYPLMSKGYHWEAIIYLLVIAAAFGSPLAKGLGLGKVGDFVIGAQTEVATTTLDEIEVYFGEEMAPGFFCLAGANIAAEGSAGVAITSQPGTLPEKVNIIPAC